MLLLFFIIIIITRFVSVMLCAHKDTRDRSTGDEDGGRGAEKGRASVIVLPEFLNYALARR